MLYITDKQYAESGGIYCPNCGTNTVSSSAHKGCSNCGTTWFERYELVGYKDVVVRNKAEDSILVKQLKLACVADPAFMKIVDGNPTMRKLIFGDKK